MYKGPHVRATFRGSDVVSRGRRKGLCTLSKVIKMCRFCTITKNNGRRGTFEEDLQRCISRGRRSTKHMFIRDVRRSGRWFPERGCILEHQICRFAKMILRDRCSTSYDLASIFRGRRRTLDRWSGNIAKCIGTRPSALRSTFHFGRKSRRIALFFPTCQVRVVRFYQSCSPPPPPPHPPPPRPPPPRSPDPSGHCRTSTASCRSQWALPDLNRDFQVAVGTAGPQPRLPGCSGHCRTSTASSRSQWALPDLNHDFQIAVGTAGPQPRLPDRSGHCRTSTGRMSEKMSDRMSEDMPDRMPERMSERMSEDMPDRMSEDMPERMSEDMSDRMSEDMPDRMPEKMSERMSEDMPDKMSEDMPEDLPDRMPEDMPEHMPEDMPDRMPDRMPEDMSDRMPEDLPVRKCINVMVGIIRSEVIDVVKFKNWKRLAELLCFWCCQVQKMKRSRRIALFWMLSSSENEEVSQNWFILDVVNFEIEEVSQNCFVFDVVTCKHWGSLGELLRVWCCQRWKMRKSRRAAFLMLSTLKNEEVSQNS